MLLVLSLVFAAILLFSIFKPSMNPGLPALVLVFFIAPLLPEGSAGNVAQLFPTSLFLTLWGVTFFFSLLNSSGLIDCVLQRIILLVRPFPRFLPLVLFGLVAGLTAAGLGNIATIALMAPLAIPLAKELQISAFLMTALIVGAANAASFSPLTLPGIFTNDFIQRSPTLAASLDPSTLRWWIFWSVFVCISATATLSFLFMGGKKWLASIHSAALENQKSNSKENLQPLSKQQRNAAHLAVVFALVFVLGCLFNLPALKESFSPEFLQIAKRFGDVGFMGWLGSGAMLLFGLGSFERSLKSIPWGTLLLVCGMSTYIELLSRVGLAEAVSALVQKNIAEGLLPAAFASSAALLSAFSSSVGVALPVFMPIVEAVSKTLETGLTQTLIIAVAVGSHLVDASPLSTLGALCLAQIRDSEEQNRAYRALLVYSFVMIPVAALWAFVIELLF
jgi:di/tricarboxylate transporter